MNDLERFKAVVRGQEPDYVPIFGFSGAPGMSAGCMKKTHDHLVRTGMPAHVGGAVSLSTGTDSLEGWQRYWGTTGPIGGPYGLTYGAEGFAPANYRVEGDHCVIEGEDGSITRQLLDNDITYIMPEFIRYAVRDRDSWEFWKQRATPKHVHPPEKLEEMCAPLDVRDRPLACGAGGAYSFLRGMLGPEGLSLMLYDDPELIHEMAAWQLEQTRLNLPIIERLKPEIAVMGEDLCYNHGMLLSPAQFDEFCGPHYRMVCDCAKASDVDIVAIDTDGNLMEFADVAGAYGVNALYPCEVKAGNDLFVLRDKHPEMVLFGWLEKEVVNEGNEAAIEPEILGKVPPLLARGRYFPNGDHGIQPMVTFENLRKFMTILHEVCRNPEGEFPRA